MLGSGDPYRVECLLALGTQRLELGEIDGAREALRMAGDAAGPRQSVLAEVLMCRANVLTLDQDGGIDEFEEIVGDAVRHFQEWGDGRGLAHAYLTQADLAGMRCEVSRSTKLLELALKHGEAAGDAGCLAHARTLLGVALLFGPVPAEEAIASLDLMVTSSGGDLRVRAEAEQVTCVLHAMCGRFDQARAIGADARQHLAQVGPGLFLANLAQSTGHVEELAGDLGAAEREYERSTADLEALREKSYLSTVAGLHARLLARQGKRGPAEAALELARRNGSPDDVTTQSLVRQTDGLLAAAAGEAGGARAALTEALQMEAGDEVPDSVGETNVTGADVERRLGNPPGEREHLAMAQRLFEVKGNVVRAHQVASRLRRCANPG
jgi:ATP/maltotriose-dependent transcriptional regulator MalT